ncbi:MAG: hypothetical protein WCP97_01465 [bacterium]
MGELALVAVVLLLSFSFIKVKSTTSTQAKTYPIDPPAVTLQDKRPRVLPLEWSQHTATATPSNTPVISHTPFTKTPIAVPSNTAVRSYTPYIKTPTYTPSPVSSGTPLPTHIPVMPNNNKSLKNFWARDFKAQWITQTQAATEDQYFDVFPGDTILVKIQFRNRGIREWMAGFGENSDVYIAIYKDPNVKSSWSGKDDPQNQSFGTSEFAYKSWHGTKVGTFDQLSVLSGSLGELATFTIPFTIPYGAPVGKFREDITLAAGKYWMESVPETADPIGAAHIWVGFDIHAPVDKMRTVQQIHGDPPLSYSFTFATYTWKMVDSGNTDPQSYYQYLRLKEIPECSLNYQLQRTVSVSEPLLEPVQTTTGSEIQLERRFTNNQLTSELYYPIFFNSHLASSPTLILNLEDVPEDKKALCSAQALEIAKTFVWQSPI